MELYLVQHGVAKPEQEDSARPLSDRGRTEVERVAHAAARLGLDVARISHSAKLRARQTAEILAAALRPAGGVREVANLAPNDDPSGAVRLIERLSESEMLVGHLPHLSRLASLLLVGDASRELIAFRMGGIVCLERDDSRWHVKWILTPELAP